MTNHIELSSLAAQLTARYPGVRIVRANLYEDPDGSRVQNIRYQAPLAILQDRGLLTRSMLELARTTRRLHVTPLGDLFLLWRTWADVDSRPGSVDLWILTREWPVERERLSVAKAKRYLGHLVRPCRRLHDKA